MTQLRKKERTMYKDPVAIKDFYFIIDNGHGYNTAGKRSPDGSFREYIFARTVARKVVYELQMRGYNAILLVPEEYDVKLERTEYLRYDENMGDIPWTGCKSVRHRVGRVNDICGKYGSNNCVLASIHCNAAGNGSSWMNASGWSIFVSANRDGTPSRRSRLCANTFVDIACDMGLKVRTPLPDQKYWVKSLAMTRDTNCPAVLTENLFMDNKGDCEWLKTEEGVNTIVKLHVDALIAYYEKRYTV